MGASECYIEVGRVAVRQKSVPNTDFNFDFHNNDIRVSVRACERAGGRKSKLTLMRESVETKQRCNRFILGFYYING